MNNKIKRIFQGLTLTTFTMGVYNTLNGLQNKNNICISKEEFKEKRHTMWNKIFSLINNITLKILMVMFCLNNSDVYYLFLLGGIIGIILYLYCEYINNLDYLFTIYKRFDKYLIYSCIAFFIICIVSKYMDTNWFYQIKIHIFNTIRLEDKEFTISDIKFSMKDVWEGVNFIGGAAVFSGGLKASTSILKSTTMSAPPSVKLGFVLAGGTASFFTFKIANKIWQATSYSTTLPSDGVDITIKKSSSGNFEVHQENNPKSPLEDETQFSHLVDVLSDSLNLYICIFVIINLCIIFLFLKIMSDREYNFDWLSKFKYGATLRTKLVKVLSYWRTSNLIFFYVGMFMIWLFTGINLIFLKYVLTGLLSL